MNPPNSDVPAGWYQVDAESQRYWDGNQWTDHVAPLANPGGDGSPSDTIQVPNPTAAPDAGPAQGSSPPFEQASYAQPPDWQNNPGAGPGPGAGPAPGPGAVPGAAPFQQQPVSMQDGYYQTAATTSDDRTMAVLAHLLALVSGFLGPLIIWLIRKDQSAFVDDQAKEALNFNLSMMLYWTVAWISLLVLVGLLLLPILAVVNFVMPIVAAVAANRGEQYRYPLTIRFIS